MITCVQVDGAAVATKRCTKCGASKCIDQFNRNSSARDGRQARCKDCLAQYRGENRARIISRMRAYNATNRRKLARANRAYYLKNRATLNAKNAQYRRKRFAGDVTFRVSNAAKCRINHAIRGLSKSAHTEELIGCTIGELMSHLEAQFKPGMSWENYGRQGWHVDHRHPCAMFDLNDPDQQRACFHFSNLQPLWWHENLSKGARVAA